MKTKTTLEVSVGSNLMNTQYAVMFGVIFAFCFYVDHRPKSHVSTAIRSEIALVFIPLLLYFLVDWARMNFLKRKINFTFWFIFFWTISIWCLGLIIVMSNALGSLRYILFAAYIVFVSIYDIVLISKDLVGNLTSFQSRFLGFLAGITFVVGALLLFCALFPNSVVIDNRVYSDPDKMAPIISVAFFIARGIVRTSMLLS